MNISAFENLDGRKLSVMLKRNKPNGEPETYIGMLECCKDDYIILDYNNISYKPKNNPIDKIIVSVDEIKSMWVYK